MSNALYAKFGKLLQTTPKTLVVFVIAAALVFPASYFIIPRAWASATVTSSSTQFYGPALERFLITDASKTNNCDTIVVDVKAIHGSTTLAETNVQLLNIGTSGQFELFVTTSNGFKPAFPTFTGSLGCIDANTNPFVVRVSSIATVSNSHETAFVLGGANPNLVDGDTIKVTYSGQSVTVNFAKSIPQITTDRQSSSVGNGGTVIVTLNDRNAVLDPTSIDKINVSPTQPLSINGGAGSGVNWAGAQFIEEGQNTGLFDLPVEVLSGAQTMPNPSNGATLHNVPFPGSISFTAQSFNVYNETVNLAAGVTTLSPQGIGATPPYNTVSVNSGVTATTSVLAQNTDASLQLVRAVNMANGVAAKITDLDQNLNTQSKDFLPANSVIISMDGVPGAWINSALTFQETGFNTGTFEAALTDNAIPIHITSSPSYIDNATGININPADLAANNNLYVKYNDPAANPSGSKIFQLVTTINHIQGNIGPTQQTAVLNNKFQLTINDTDLNLNRDSIDSFVVTFNSADSSAQNLSQCFDAGLGCLTMKVDGAALNFIAHPMTITFVESGANTGFFTASNVDSAIINAADGNGLRDGDQVAFTYFDHSENPIHTSTATISIASPPVSIASDRSAIPNPVTPDGPVELTLTIADPKLNTNPSTIQTVVLGPSTNLNVAITEKDGITTLPGTIGGLTSSSNTLIPQSYTETGINTGIFTFKYFLDNSGTATVAQLDNAKIKFTYTSGGIAKVATVTIKSYDGSIVSTQSTVQNGDTIALLVTDRDLNRDNTVVDHACITLKTVNDTIGLPTTFCDLAETTPSSGIFIKTITIGTDIKIADPNTNLFATQLQVHYTDELASDLSVNVDRELDLKIATHTGTLSASPALASSTSLITILVSDDDLNVNPNVVDSTSPTQLYMRITSNATNANVLSSGITGVETGPDSGVFMTTLKLSTASSPATSGTFTGSGTSIFGTALPGDVIKISYFDQKNSLGQKAIVTRLVHVVK